MKLHAYITTPEGGKWVSINGSDMSVEVLSESDAVYTGAAVADGKVIASDLENYYEIDVQNGYSVTKGDKFTDGDGAECLYILDGTSAPKTDVTLPDLANLCDAFYIGGTKVGALFGEALVLTHPALKRDFRYLIKQHGGMLAKGRLLGIQFETLFEDGLYWQISDHALRMADTLRAALMNAGLPMQVQSPTNQLFPIVPDTLLAKIREKYAVTYMNRVDECSSCIRLCTSWATREEDVLSFCADLEKMM